MSAEKAPKAPREDAGTATSVEAASDRLRELGAVFHSISEGLVFVTPDGHVAQMNPAALRMHGFSSVSEARQPITELARVFEVRDLEGRRVPDSLRPAARALRGESFADLELRVRRAGDPEGWIGSFNGGPVFDGAGKVALAVVTIRDVTARARAEAERRRVEEALRASEERFRTAVHASPLVVFQQDRELRYTWIENPAVGSDAEWFLGKTDSDVFEVPEEARALEEIKRRVVEEGTGERSQVTLHIDGRRCLYDLTVEPLRDGGGNVVGVTGAAVDVTRHVELEERLRHQTRRLAEADRRKDEFLAMLAHELRSPLAPIRNAAEILRVRRQGEDTPAEPEVETIHRQVNQLARLVDDLLDVARITRGLVDLRHERTSLEHVVALAVETTGPDLGSRAADLTVRLPDEPVVLEGDPVRLAQVVANLLSNAAKYSDPGTPIELRAERAGPDGGEVTISVRDQGIGMSRELLDEVFDVFFQVESSLARARGGLGLGLTLVKSLVEMHGGSVRARSEGVGHGSEFVVRLPLAAGTEAAPEAEPTGAAGAEGRPGRRVLVVDDSVDTAESFAELLRLSGHQVEVAYDGRNALLAVERFSPDVVFLDIGLPEMDGFEVARRLRSLPGSDPPVLVALTGYGQEESRRRAREAGFDHHLLKPVAFDRVRRILSTSAQSRSD